MQNFKVYIVQDSLEFFKMVKTGDNTGISFTQIITEIGVSIRLAETCAFHRHIHKGWFINFRNKSILCHEKFKKKTQQSGRMEFFTLITQVSSRSDHTDNRTGQACKDELILAYGRKCLEKKHGCHIDNAQIEWFNTSFEASVYRLVVFQK